MLLHVSQPLMLYSVPWSSNSSRPLLNVGQSVPMSACLGRISELRGPRLKEQKSVSSTTEALITCWSPTHQMAARVEHTALPFNST